MMAMEKEMQRENKANSGWGLRSGMILAGGLVGVTMAAGAVLGATKTVATGSGTASDSRTSQASVTVSATCSMTARVDTEHTATLPAGVWSGTGDYYPNGIGKTTIQTFCNDAAGYSIYAVGYTGNTMDGGANNKLHSTQLGSGYDIVTGTAHDGATSNWAMKVTKVTDSSTSFQPANLVIQNGYDSENYHEVPASYQEVARYSTATDATLGSLIETTYSAYIAATQPASTYTGKVKYTLVHPGGAGMPDMTDMQSVASWGGSLAVGEERTVVDSRDNQAYTVARLCTNYSGDDCTSSQLWMTQNLNFQIGGTYASGVTSINSNNTDLNNAYEPDGTTLKKDYSVDNGVITWTPTTTNTTAPGETTNQTLTGSPVLISDFAYSGSATTVAPDWRNQQYYPYQAEGTLNGTEMYQWPGGNTSYGPYTNCLSSNRTAEVCNHYAIGNYYNWTAANAMSNSSQYTTLQAVMDNSICPKGWRLPKGIESGQAAAGSEYNRLLVAQGVANGVDTTGSTNVGYVGGGYNRLVTRGIHDDPLYFARSGYLSGTTLYNSAYYGYYWSSSIAGSASTDGYSLRFNSGSLYPAGQYLRYDGFSVRCVAR